MLKKILTLLAALTVANLSAATGTEAPVVDTTATAPDATVTATSMPETSTVDTAAITTAMPEAATTATTTSTPEIATTSAEPVTAVIAQGTPASFESLKTQFARVSEDLIKIERLSQTEIDEQASSNWWANLFKTSRENKAAFTALWDEAEAAIGGESSLSRVGWWKTIGDLSKKVDEEFAIAQNNQQEFNIGRLTDLKNRVSKVKSFCSNVFQEVSTALDNIPLKIRNEIESVTSLFNELRNQEVSQSSFSVSSNPRSAARAQAMVETRAQANTASKATAPIVQKTASRRQRR